MRGNKNKKRHLDLSCLRQLVLLSSFMSALLVLFVHLLRSVKFFLVLLLHLLNSFCVSTVLLFQLLHLLGFEELSHVSQFISPCALDLDYVLVLLLQLLLKFQNNIELVFILQLVNQCIQ